MTVTFDREVVSTATMGGERLPDEDWSFTDHAGHTHAWQKGKKKPQLPTLKWVKTGTRWVGDEYGGDEYDVGEYRCRECNVVVEPKYTWRSTEGDFILGPAAYTLSVNIPPFGIREIRLSEDEVVELVAIAGDEIAFRSWVEGVRQRWMDTYAT